MIIEPKGGVHYKQRTNDKRQGACLKAKKLFIQKKKTIFWRCENEI